MDCGRTCRNRMSAQLSHSPPLSKSKPSIANGSARSTFWLRGHQGPVVRQPQFQRRGQTFAAQLFGHPPDPFDHLLDRARQTHNPNSVTKAGCKTSRFGEFRCVLPLTPALSFGTF
jgi:hypothetical protein